MRWCWVFAGLMACGSGNDTAVRHTSAQPQAQHACTQIGCGPAFDLQFNKQTPWKGTYRFEVAFDAASPTTCHIKFPLDCNVEQRCEGPNAGDFHIGESGCALPHQSQELVGVSVNQGVAPAALSIVVFQASKRIASQRLALTYTQSFPNGPKCEPRCMSAPSAELSLP